MIEFRNVTKSYGDFTAVEDISFSACDSSVCGLIGYNGAGKTTLIKCAAGLYKPDSGKVLIDGESTYNSDEVRSRLFFVPDDLFFPVGSTPNSAARFYKDYYPEFSFGNFERMLKLFELDGDAKIRGFSKGMQRQTEIALALASSPKVLLLDECLDGLDIAKKDICKQLFMDYMAQSGCTMLISSHAIADLQNLCDRIVLISGKRMQMNCCTDDIPSTWRKFRLQFDFEPTRSIFGNIDIKKLDIDGRSAVVTVCGHIDDARAKLDALEPLFIDEFPMELEEIFLQETEDKSDEISKVFDLSRIHCAGGSMRIFSVQTERKGLFHMVQGLARCACFYLILHCARRRDTGGIYPAVHQHKESVKCVVQLQSQPLDAL